MDYKAQYTENVRKVYDRNLLAFTEERKDGYFNDKEAQKYLESCYKTDMEMYKKGEITKRQFLEGGANAVGYCLALMCD